MLIILTHNVPLKDLMDQVVVLYNILSAWDISVYSVMSFVTMTHFKGLKVCACSWTRSIAG